MTLAPSPEASLFVRAQPGRIALFGLYLFFTAQVARTLTAPDPGGKPGDYVALFAVFIILFTLVLWRPNLPRIIRHLYLLVQSALTLGILALDPVIDSNTALFVLLTYQAALIFNGRERWIWIAVLALLIPVSIAITLGPLFGLAAGLTPMAASLLLPAIVAENEEIERAHVQSEKLVAELQELHRRLETHATQVEELATIEERNRLARELHDSVSQTLFAITLNTRSAQMLLERDPQKVRPQLEQLQAQAQNALTHMRQLISQMRP